MLELWTLRLLRLDNLPRNRDGPHLLHMRGAPLRRLSLRFVPIGDTMTLTIIDVEQRSEAWYDARRGIVTASAVSKLLTPTLKVADNDTSRGLTATLAAERITGWTEETGMTSDMWRGVEHEPFARDHYSGHHQQAVQCGFMRREEDGWTLGLSPDGLVGDDGGVEIKCPRAKTHINWTLADEVPAQHMAQIQAALLVSGRDWWDFCSFVAGLPLFVKRVLPDPAWHEAIIAAAASAELAIDLLVGDYELATKGLPKTERIDLNIVELKL